MKKRNGFVSNSSASSFIICLSQLTPEQIEKVKNWKTEGFYLMGKCPCFKDRELTEKECRKCYEIEKERYERYKISRKNKQDTLETFNETEWPEFDKHNPYEFPYCWNKSHGAWMVSEQITPITLKRDVFQEPKTIKDDVGLLIISGLYGGNFPMRKFLEELGINEYYEMVDVCSGDGPFIVESPKY